MVCLSLVGHYVFHGGTHIPARILSECYCAVFPTQYVTSTFESLGPGLPVQGLVPTPVSLQLIQMELPESFIEP